MNSRCSPLLHERQKSKIAKLKQQKKLFLRSRPSKSNNTIAFCDLYFFSSLYSVAVLRSYSSRTILFCHALSLCLFETTTHTYQPHTTNALTQYSARKREQLVADIHARERECVCMCWCCQFVISSVRFSALRESARECRTNCSVCVSECVRASVRVNANVLFVMKELIHTLYDTSMARLLMCLYERVN